MEEFQYERNLGIDTLGDFDWADSKGVYNRYEPTTYKYLDYLFQNYKPDGNDKLVDFGCGKGRVLFYVQNRFQIPVKGIEANSVVFQSLEENIQRYKEKFPEAAEQIQIAMQYAEGSEIQNDESIFYFFNPFDISIFQVIYQKIEEYYHQNPRKIDIILYYPTREYTNFMLARDEYDLLEKVFLPNLFDMYEKFYIYRRKA